jgi:hypothetical protein
MNGANGKMVIAARHQVHWIQQEVMDLPFAASPHLSNGVRRQVD